MRIGRPPGATLTELIVVLAILAVLAGGGALALWRGMEVMAVRGARDSMAAVVARVRAQAVANGVAVLVVDPVAAEVWIEAPPGARSGGLRLGDAYGVTLTADHHSGGAIRLEFDGLGFGRVASRTFRIRRGSAEARLTLSTYGRPRRW